MKKLIVLSLMFAFVAVGVTSCKYEEGGLSLRSKTARLTGEWQLNQVMQDGVEINSYPDDFSFIFNEDNSFEVVENNISIDGEWKFNDDKTEVNILIDGGTETEDYLIIKLKNKELILEQIESAAIPAAQIQRLFFIQE